MKISFEYTFFDGTLLKLKKNIDGLKIKEVSNTLLSSGNLKDGKIHKFQSINIWDQFPNIDDLDSPIFFYRLNNFLGCERFKIYYDTDGFINEISFFWDYIKMGPMDYYFFKSIPGFKKLDWLK